MQIMFDCAGPDNLHRCSGAYPVSDDKVNHRSAKFFKLRRSLPASLSLIEAPYLETPRNRSAQPLTQAVELAGPWPEERRCSMNAFEGIFSILGAGCDKMERYYGELE